MSNILYLFYVISKFGSFRHAEEVGFNSGCLSWKKKVTRRLRLALLNQGTNTMKKFLLILAIISMANFTKADETPVVKKLQEISVTIKAETAFGSGSQGSGVLFTRKVGDKTVTYVWTAAHVVDSLRKTHTVITNGTSKVVVEFEDAKIVREFKEKGRRVGEIKMDAQVIRYSDATHGEDLALLRVRQTNFSQDTATFGGDDVPDIGTEVYHVGSLLGQVGANSLTTGVVSQTGRVLDLGANGVVFDQTTATVFPGSSGGGMFNKVDGQYIGMLVRGSGEGFNFIVPIRRLRTWAKSAGVEWAIDPNAPMPSAEEMAKLPIEDNGVKFEASAEKAPFHFPYLILRCGEPTHAEME